MAESGRNISEEGLTWAKAKTFFQLDNMKAGFRAVFAKRNYNLRRYILLMVFCFEMEMFINVGEWSSSYLYLRRKLEFTMSQYTRWIPMRQHPILIFPIMPYPFLLLSIQQIFHYCGCYWNCGSIHYHSNHVWEAQDTWRHHCPHWHFWLFHPDTDHGLCIQGVDVILGRLYCIPGRHFLLHDSVHDQQICCSGWGWQDLVYPGGSPKFYTNNIKPAVWNDIQVLLF